MKPQLHIRCADRTIGTIASQQFGVVARRQLLQAGVSPQQIKARLRNGRLLQVHRGIYLVGHGARAARAHETAALLACGPKAVLSHRSAAALWDLLPYPPAAPVCITLPVERSARRAGIVIHRAALTRADVRRRHGLLVTSPPRTVLDLAGETKRSGRPGAALAPARLDELELLVAEAQFRRLAREHELREQLERNPNKPGTIALRAVLAIPGGPRRTRSPGERAMLRLLRERAITGYEVNVKIGGYEVDFLWRDLSFALEVDG